MPIGRRPSFGLRSPLVGALVAVTALLALAAQAQGATRMDYGDAPDGADARYSVAVTGKFPSLLSSSGPRHRQSGPSLGIGRDKEGDSKQVDRDRFDDGVSLDRLGQCSTSQLTVLIDTRRIPARLLRKHDLYLNSWFDWDRSGVWGEANGCPGVALLRNNEWSIVNQRISGKAFLRNRVRAFSFRFKAGRHVGELWMRATLTLGQKLPINPLSRSGGATSKPFAYGETEDYLIQRSPGEPPEFPDPSGKEKKKEKKKEKEKKEKEKKEKEEKEREEKEKKEGVGGPFRVSCIPNPATVEHGKAVKVRFFVKDEGKGPIFGKTLSKKRTRAYRARVLRHRNQRGVPRGYFRAAGFSFKSRQRDKRANPVERHVMTFGFQRGKVKQVLKCLVNVIHDKIVKAKKPHRPKPVPPAPPVVPPPDSSGSIGPFPSSGDAGSGNEEQQPSVQGQGSHQPTGDPQQFQMILMFNQDVDGYRIKLKGGAPPEIIEVQSPPGLECEVDGESVLCTGAIPANMLITHQVKFDPPPGPTGLDGRLELCAIQDGEEIGPFPMPLTLTT